MASVLKESVSSGTTRQPLHEGNTMALMIGKSGFVAKKRKNLTGYIVRGTLLRLRRPFRQEAIPFLQGNPNFQPCMPHEPDILHPKP